MYGGSVVESGPTDEVFAGRAHPYTRGLFARAARGWARRAASGWRRSPARVPELVDLPPGCPFAGRCRFDDRRLPRRAAAAVAVAPGHHARCIRLDAVAASAAGIASLRA